MQENTKIGILLMVLWICYACLSPLVAYGPWFKWWKNHDPKNEYHCVPLVSMAYFTAPTFLYDIVQVIIPPSDKFEHNWMYYFINGIMQGQAKDFTGGRDGLCTPKSLCKSLVPDNFMTLYKDEVANENFWRNTLRTWGAGVNDAVSTGEKAILWADDNNFLYKWGIPYDANAVYAFMTNDTMSGSDDKVFAALLYPLLGINSDSMQGGGWVGYLKAGGDFGGDGLAGANREIFASENNPKNQKMGKKGKPGCNAPRIVQGGFSGGLAIAAMCLMGTVTLGWGIAFVAAGAVAGAGIPALNCV